MGFRFYQRFRVGLFRAWIGVAILWSTYMLIVAWDDYMGSGLFRAKWIWEFWINRLPVIFGPWLVTFGILVGTWIWNGFCLGLKTKAEPDPSYTPAHNRGDGHQDQQTHAPTITARR
jgi:hypothetical protein